MIKAQLHHSTRFKGFKSNLSLSVIAMIGFATSCTEPDETSSGLNNDPAATVRLSYVRELPLKAIDRQGHSANALSSEGRRLRALWVELEEFKHDPKFHALGFENAFQYGEWRGAVRTLNDTAGKKLFKQIGIIPGELETLGDEYLKAKGRQTEMAGHILERFDGALIQKEVSKQQGVTAIQTQGCSDFPLLAQSLRALENNEFQASNQFLDKAGCMNIAKGAIISLPTRRFAYEWLDGDKSKAFALVKTQRGDLWLPEDDLLF